jgi:hypothetical protein
MYNIYILYAIELSWTFDMDQLIEYYNIYIKMMLHWNSIPFLQKHIIHINIDEIIDTPIKSITSLFQKLNLHIDTEKGMNIEKEVTSILKSKNLVKKDLWKKYYNHLVYIISNLRSKYVYKYIFIIIHIYLYKYYSLKNL